MGAGRRSGGRKGLPQPGPRPQVQAAVVGLLAAVAALLLGLASGQGLDVVEAQVLCASSVLTASLAACALGEWPSRGWGAPRSSRPP